MAEGCESVWTKVLGFKGEQRAQRGEGSGRTTYNSVP